MSVGAFDCLVVLSFFDLVDSGNFSCESKASARFSRTRFPESHLHGLQTRFPECHLPSLPARYIHSHTEGWDPSQRHPCYPPVDGGATSQGSSLQHPYRISYCLSQTLSQKSFWANLSLVHLRGPRHWIHCQESNGEQCQCLARMGGLLVSTCQPVSQRWVYSIICIV